MSAPILMDRALSTLLVVDVQGRLLPAIDAGDAVLGHCVALVSAAGEMAVPCVISEQYPEGLGPTVDTLLDVAAKAQRVTKRHFSCVAEGCLAATAVSARPQVVVCGTEAHVCVQQTVLELLAQGKTVFVVADAVGSRLALSKQLALERMRAAGAAVVTREMVIFEWLRVAGTDEFRRIHQRYLR